MDMFQGLSDEDLAELLNHAASNRVDERLYPNPDFGVDFTVKELALKLLKLKLRHNLTDTSFNEWCALQRALLPEPNNYPTSLYDCKKAIRMEDVWDYS